MTQHSIKASLIAVIAITGLCLPAYAVEAYVETWDNGSLEGWTQNTAWTTVELHPTGGNPDGFVYSYCNQTTNRVGTQVWNKPEFSGDYAAAGIYEISVDLNFFAGDFISSYWRFRHDAVDNGWYFPLTNDFTFDRWQTVGFTFDPTWTDAEALAAGWLDSSDLTFAETLGAVQQVEVTASTSSYGSGIMGIDNVRLIPEPTTLALIAAGAALLRRRRS